ncbi:LOW QUALITY PROTEIN: bark storage protein A [Jatropha curcas]|uniref:LOW QUALITY PROTEIN: bark storage protein A n=1 Tax=Jatropha curcas TaxID=180498 RepID=UPI001895E8B2|nr:LOW QUALITY PROTEIN: bark storage protein A [Jatropha curcas]
MAARKTAQCFTMLLLVWIFLQVILVSAAVSSKKRVSWIKIKEINKVGLYIGLVTVYTTEENAFFATGAFMPNPKYPFVDLSGRRFRVGTIYEKKVIYVRCGIGLVNAAAATQQMLDLFDMTGIIHFGIAGNLNNSMFIGDVSIPKKFANTGLWDWLNPNGTVSSSDVAEHKNGSYHCPSRRCLNCWETIVGYSNEQFFSVKEANAAEPLFWAEVNQHWLHLAASLEGMELDKCVNSSLCLTQKPKLVVGLKGSTANIFLYFL